MGTNDRKKGSAFELLLRLERAYSVLHQANHKGKFLGISWQDVKTIFWYNYKKHPILGGIAVLALSIIAIYSISTAIEYQHLYELILILLESGVSLIACMTVIGVTMLTSKRGNLRHLLVDCRESEALAEELSTDFSDLTLEESKKLFESKLAFTDSEYSLLQIFKDLGIGSVVVSILGFIVKDGNDYSKYIGSSGIIILIIVRLWMHFITTRVRRFILWVDLALLVQKSEKDGLSK